MNTLKLINLWKHQPKYQSLISALAPGSMQQIIGLTGFASSSLCAALKQDTNVPLMIVTPSQDMAKSIYSELVALLSQEEVYYFPPLELLPYEVFARNLELVGQRLTTLVKLAEGQSVVVIVAAETLTRKVTPRENFKKYIFNISTGQRLDVMKIAEQLIKLGYSRESLVEVPGSFSVRGGIIDIYPFTEKLPIRIELFDDEVESVRTFDPLSQRSKDAVNHVTISPAREIIGDGDTMFAGKERLEAELSTLLASLAPNQKRQIRERFFPYVEHLAQGIWTEGMEQIFYHLYPRSGSLTDYLAENSILVIHEPDRVRETIERISQERSLLYYDLLEGGQVLPSFAENFLSFDLIKEDFARKQTVMVSSLPETGGLKVDRRIQVLCRELPLYKDRLGRLKEDIQHYQNRGYRFILTASSNLRAAKMRDILQEMGVRNVDIVGGAFNKGFECPELQTVVITEREILGQEVNRRPRRTFREGEKITTFLDLKGGDLVVHVNHGIGRYLGVERLDIGGAKRDYLHIQYAGQDKLYVPTDQVDLIQKYVGSEGHQPKLYKLGGTEWNRVKHKVRQSVQNMAKELLELYAAREAVQGHAFSPDNSIQQEFEDAFPYPETPDQLRAVTEIKKDMEKSRPMDRLLCGDVGYGKTEVALRAAFKAVNDGKQVAVLVPTTVLAQQHQRTFEERFAGFPVTIASLSRFKTGKEISRTLQGLARGGIDIVIGTHRLLSEDVKFKDVGLLIIDEEQRFGVGHKEKIKMLKHYIDVLTLTATPIPRTLHMSLVGARDMSVIETPPEDRQPVQTYVVEYNDQLVKEAIQREIKRKGQVYFVHNRVNDIYRIAGDIEKLVPEAEIIVAHGQMKEHELEAAMLDFIDGTGNVLVCTTIIESGLDIPNVNTLVVNNADQMGLAQLYQLRGRVGRSHRQAFAYFTYRKDRVLTDIARKRLVAIRDFTELGSGFKIAMRDLEIRGAGNILGPEQHGHVMAVGFDLYVKLLQEEVKKLQGVAHEPIERQVPLIELDFDAFIPDTYVAESELKIEFYKRLVAARKTDEVDELEIEAEERFGVMPESVRNLFKLGKLRVIAERLHVAAITQQKNTVVVKFSPHHRITGAHLAQVVKELGRRVSFNVTGELEIIIKIEGFSEYRVLQVITDLLEKLIAFAPSGHVI